MSAWPRWAALLLLTALGGCAWLVPKPEPLTTLALLDQFPDQVPWPVAQAVEIHWQDNLVPFVEARSDSDCAFAIGVVHAFLRLGQMEVFRRGSAGRLAESLGPIGAPDIDELVRKLDLDRAAAPSLAMMSAADRVWLDRYLEGINFFVAHTPALPAEFDLLALRPEPWTAKDSLRIGKLGSADPNWATLLGLLPLRGQPGWESVWNRTLRSTMQSEPTQRAAATSDIPGLAGLQRWLNLGARAGSNSLVISGARSASGGALIASDPHLGIFVPNLWLLMGYRCPSYEVVGYMLPGVPTVTLGRNPRIAWGGTAMRGISTHLFEVEAEQLTHTREERIRIRGGFERVLRIPESLLGPVVFETRDGSRARRVALNWTGHQPGDDLGAFLAANRARNWDEFRAAFGTISGPSLNITYADAEGHVGFLPAIRQPLLLRREEQMELVKSSDNGIAAYRSPLELPSLLDPPEGFIASANNLPVRTEPALALPNADNGRKRRLDELAATQQPVTVTDLMRWQQDVYSADAVAMRDLLLDRLGDALPASVVVERLRGWDGRYDLSSIGAVAYERVLAHLVRQVAEQLPLSEALRARWLSFDDWRNELHQWLLTHPDEEGRRLVRGAVTQVERSVDQYPTWGEWHRQPLQSPLGLLPVLGRRYRYGDFPAPGGAATVHKGTFPIGDSPRSVIFGAQARHVSDLADVDENYFVMLGGNAGWLDNAALLDQVALWRAGRYVQIPLSPAAVRRTFTLRTHRPLVAGGDGSPVAELIRSTSAKPIKDAGA